MQCAHIALLGARKKECRLATKEEIKSYVAYVNQRVNNKYAGRAEGGGSGGQ